MNRIIATLCLATSFLCANAQNFDRIEQNGTITDRDIDGNRTNRNFNKHNNDTTRNKEIPKGLRVWKIDRKFGDMFPAVPDTMPHLLYNPLVR